MIFEQVKRCLNYWQLGRGSTDPPLDERWRNREVAFFFSQLVIQEYLKMSCAVLDFSLISLSSYPCSKTVMLI